MEEDVRGNGHEDFCTALRPNPYGESRVSEERDTLDFGGDGGTLH